MLYMCHSTSFFLPCPNPGKKKEKKNVFRVNLGKKTNQEREQRLKKQERNPGPPLVAPLAGSALPSSGHRCLHKGAVTTTTGLGLS